MYLSVTQLDSSPSCDLGHHCSESATAGMDANICSWINEQTEVEASSLPVMVTGIHIKIAHAL